MRGYANLSAAELAVLRAAVHRPIEGRDPALLRLCQRLRIRHLLQQAGDTAAANGWRGSPHAFMLTRDGWRLVKAAHGQRPFRQAS